MPKVAKKTVKRVKKGVPAPEVPVEAPYTASIKLYGKVYTVQGESVKEALSKLDVGKIAKGAAVLTISRGDKTRSKILPGITITRLLGEVSRITKEITMKNVSLMFADI